MEVSVSIFIYICFTVLEINCEILRLSCKSYANFSMIKHDYVLEGSVIKTLHFVSENKCKSGCVMTPRCKSYNREIDGDQRCELNDKTPEDKKDLVTVVRRPGWIFGSTDFKFHLLGQICEEKDPCPEGVMCRDTCECPGYECHPCKYGKTGLRCDVDDACASNPCQNNGICVNGVTFFTCTCAPGYTGSTCSTVDACASNPCQNDGTCVNGVTLFTCTCAPGLTGKTCSTSTALSCSSYAVLSEANRAVSNTQRSPLLCDLPLQSGWYRFTGAAGNRMLDACQADRGTVFRCQTHAGGWLNGTHPLIADGEVNRTVCFSWETSCCDFAKAIKVRNCGGFYVYYLGNVSHCFMRYCGLQ